MIKKIILAVMVAASFIGITSVSTAAIIVRVAPPPPRVESVPPPRRGYVWAPGHWEWRHNHHQWVGGKWLRERRGYVYNPPTWEQHDGRWMMQSGRWARTPRDRDGDGVPNRQDDHPDNPNRR